ncbi:MAG: single-stranded-DNA-specific exonuclease RecJ [Candidatus Chisholmbacteria bacterium]|nr:single-stranded-DNA-specific exonuclease RecJ [Candidatus Chisholmbacteria bacterium]
MKVWKIHQKISSASAEKRRQLIINWLLKERGLTTLEKQKQFLQPPLPTKLAAKELEFDAKNLRRAIDRVVLAIKSQEPIIVYGDYDADGICATAILWETLHQLGAKALPFLPHRLKHGYGLSVAGLKDALKEISAKPLVITVDNGIVAHEAVDYANQEGIDVVITDHHVAAKSLPKAHSFVHTTKLAGSGVAWFFAQAIAKRLKKPIPDTLELAAIGSVADMVPLLGANRNLVKHGLESLKHTTRIGLKHLFQEAQVDPKIIDTYQINYIVAPRLNAMGRLGHALDSLRLLCTTNFTRARELATTLGVTNRDRQLLTEEQLLHAQNLAKKQLATHKVLVVAHESYHEGVIGLIAGKLTEIYWRPAIVLSLNGLTAKASARSIPGYDIIAALRQFNDLFVNVGGHPMAAGFTIEARKIATLTKKLQGHARKILTWDMLQRTLNIDCEINLADITQTLHHELTQFEPFGMDNQRPVFATKNVTVLDSRAVGSDKSHLKLTISQGKDIFPAIGFRLGEYAAKLSATGGSAVRGGKPHASVDLAYTLDLNQWNGKKELQLKIKDIQA